MLRKVSLIDFKTLVGKKNLHLRLHFQMKQKFVIFQFLQCHGGLLTVCSCHVMHVFQSESTLYSCLNVKELLGRSRLEI